MTTIFNKIKIIKLKRRRSARKVFLSPDLWKPLLGLRSVGLLKVGAQTHKVYFSHLNSDAPNTIGLTSALINRLGLKGVNQLNLKVDESKGQLELGPAVGVMMIPSEKKVIGIPRVYRDYFKIARSEGLLLYLFSPKDVAIKSKTIRGYRYQKKWIKDRFPLPAIVYDQIRSRQTENSSRVLQVRKYLSQQASAYFNPGFLNKWQVYEWLSKHPKVKKYLPETKIFTGIDTVLELLKNHGEIYVKPIHGSLGEGIIRIQASSDKYQCSWLMGKRLKNKVVTTHEELEKTLNKVIKHHPYIVQQGIDLLELDGCPMDIRVLVQKDDQGSWQETYAFAKVAPRGGFATNIAAGGKKCKVEEAIRLAFGEHSYKFHDVKARLQTLQKAICQALDHNDTGLGEAGIDVGIDKAGKVWVLEINSKYSRHVFPAKIKKLSIKRPLEFAQWLDGWKSTISGRGGNTNG